MMNKIKELLDNAFFIEINPGDRGYWVKLVRPLPYDKKDEIQTVECADLNEVVNIAYNLAMRKCKTVSLSALPDKMAMCAALTKAMNSIQFNPTLTSIEAQAVELTVRKMISEIENID